MIHLSALYLTLSLSASSTELNTYTQYEQEPPVDVMNICLIYPQHCERPAAERKANE